ncbi:hypothetical protein DVH24_003599 [Malus domestica]|uniref:NADPH-protochlorophyllide oxidoreductase n=1 Tax=Malus domestica TaxID=3750 RepID=A0A498INP1_MALDO|nr:hypothetical protein DVH24_003599 [Malus domestica]
MSRAGQEEDEDNEFYESLDRIVSSSCSCSTSNSDSDPDPDPDPNPNYAVPKFPMGASTKYDVWISEPSSVSERRSKLLTEMGLTGDPVLTRAKPQLGFSGEFGRSVSSDYLMTEVNSGGGGVNSIVRSKSDGGDQCNNACSTSSVSSPPFLSVRCGSSEAETEPEPETGPFVNRNTKSLVCKSSSGKSNSSPPPNKPPSGKNSRRVDEIRSDSKAEELDCNDIGKVSESDAINNAQVCTIRNLDNGKEFVVNEIREDGMWNKLKEVGTGKQLTMEEFEMSVGHSPIVQELMRRQNVEEGHKDGSESNANGSNDGVSKLKKKGGWLKSIKSVAITMTGHKDRRSSDDRDTSSEKGGRRSSSGTDDSQDVSFHGPERVRVRQYGKSCKEVTALFKSQEIQAHTGSIWSIKFSLDGKYLASAGEDCVIHIWQVMQSERKGDLLMEKSEDSNLNMLFANGSPEACSVSPNVDNLVEKKRRGRSSIGRKSVSLDHYVIPETVFALSEKPISSFQGHLDDVLDLSWSKSQHLLSSSMDKTVRLWHLASKTCLKIFSHSDYVTCIQFNPVDDRYFISGSLDAKVRIWSIPDRQVVDWNDLHEMVTAACYTPDGQFAPGSSSEVLITSADSRIRVVDGIDLVHKFKGFRNANSQISATLTANGKYVVSASEDSHVYIWKHEADSRPSRSKSVTVTRSFEHFHCQDVSAAIPWPGMTDLWGLQDSERNGLDEVPTANHPPTPVEVANANEGSRSASGCTNSPLHGIISSASNNYFFDRISATWPEEKLLLATRNRSPRVSFDFTNGLSQNMSAWGVAASVVSSAFSVPKEGKTSASFKDSSLFGVSFSDNLKAEFSSVALSCKREFKPVRAQTTATASPAINRGTSEGRKTLRKGSVIVTGASSGLGLATAKSLAESGKWHVIMACRDFLKTERAAKSAGMPKENYTIMHLDLASLDSVRQFVDNFRRSERPLDVLVCNAAVYQPTAKEPSFTAEGFELSVGTNHLGHFLLSRLLMEDLNKSDYPSRRLIIVGSITGNTNTLAGNVPPKANLGDLRGLAGGLNGLNSSAMIDGGDFDGAKAYKDSKVCNMLTMQEFHRRYHEETGITFTSLYPGCIATTGLFREHIPLFRLLFPPFQKYITKGYVSEEEAGKRLAQVVSDPSLTKSGVYWSWNKDSASFENQLSQEASDAEKARKVWEVSEKLVGLA